MSLNRSLRLEVADDAAQPLGEGFQSERSRASAKSSAVVVRTYLELEKVAEQTVKLEKAPAFSYRFELVFVIGFSFSGRT